MEFIEFQCQSAFLCDLGGPERLKNINIPIGISRFPARGRQETIKSSNYEHLQDFAETIWISRNFVDFSGISRDFAKFRGISSNSTEFHDI